MSEQYKVTGVLKLIQDVEEFKNDFKKRTFVVTTDEKYPQDLAFDLIKDKVDEIEMFEIGSEITVLFNLRGREWEGRYFTNLEAWKITGEKKKEQEYTPNLPASSGGPMNEAEDSEETEDDLPF